MRKTREFWPAGLLVPVLVFASLAVAQIPCLARFGSIRLLSQASEKDAMSLADARQYMLSLINRDRKTLGLREVSTDETAERAGTLHSDEMAKLGYLSHWDVGGRKPDQRYNEAGGTGFVMENGHIEFSGFAGENGSSSAEYKINPEAKLSKRTIDDIEGEFFNEQPPNDGHRRNILDPDHTNVGIGLSVANNGECERISCTQEFIHSYGKVEAAPRSVKAGESFVVKGSLDPGLKLQSVDLFWEELPQAMTLKELDATHSYGPPQTRVNTYFPSSPASRDALSVTENTGRQEFTCRFDTDKTLWKPGLYYVYVWVKPPDPTRQKNLVVASKTIEVR